VIQEFALSLSVKSVICGDQSTEWNILHNAVGFLSDDPLTWVENYELDCKKLGIQGLEERNYGVEIGDCYTRIIRLAKVTNDIEQGQGQQV
jgi:hypothetical protein